MRTALLRRSAALSATAVIGLAGLIAPATAHAATTVTITPGTPGLDFSQSRVNGHNDFTGDGLHVYTDGSADTGDNGTGGTWNTDKAAAYWPCTSSLGSLGNDVGMDVYFHDISQPAHPGSQVVTDFDADGIADGILVGEPVYGNDFWLTSGSAQFVKDGAPQNGGGFGSEWHGTLPEWAAAFPSAVMTQCGYSLGSGVKGDVEIKSMTYGDTTFRFSNIAPPPVIVAPVGHATETHACRTITINESVDALAAGQVAQPATVTFIVRDNGKQVQKISLAPGQSAQYTNTYPKNSTHRIKLLQDGSSKFVVKITTNCAVARA